MIRDFPKKIKIIHVQKIFLPSFLTCMVQDFWILQLYCKSMIRI